MKMKNDKKYDLITIGNENKIKTLIATYSSEITALRRANLLNIQSEGLTWYVQLRM